MSCHFGKWLSKLVFFTLFPPCLDLILLWSICPIGVKSKGEGDAVRRSNRSWSVSATPPHLVGRILVLLPGMCKFLSSCMVTCHVFSWHASKQIPKIFSHFSPSFCVARRYMHSSIALLPPLLEALAAQPYSIVCTYGVYPPSRRTPTTCVAATSRSV
jgi:hypothetical protein